MPSLAETLAGHVRQGHEIVVILPQYYLFTGEFSQIEPPEDSPYKVHIAKCPWLVPLKKARQFFVRIGRGKELAYPLRWLLNMTTFLLLTVSLTAKGLQVRRRSRKRFNLVYAHNQYASLAGLILGRCMKVPNVTRLYGTFLAELMKKPLAWLRYPVAAAGYLVPHSMLICGNDGTRGDEVARKLKIDLSRFRFWQNGLNPPTKAPRRTRGTLVKRYGAPLRLESKWILSCSRLSYWKRIDRILRAVAYCRSAGQDCQLLIAGDGQQRESLTALAEELGLVDSVVWLGVVAHDDVWALMNRADAFMITNDVTNRCNPLYEAIWASLPIVAVRHGSTADLLTHEQNAMLADMDDTDELGRGLVRIFSDDALAKRMRKAQKQRAETFWTWQERVAAEVTDLEALVAGGDRRGADGPVRG